MRVEQEQRVTEDARIFAEQDAAAQKYAAQVLEVSFFCSLQVIVAASSFAIFVSFCTCILGLSFDADVIMF